MHLNKSSNDSTVSAVPLGGANRVDNTVILHRLPSRGLRITAMISVALVLMLAVFSASPALHAWLHAHDGTQPAAVGGHNKSAPGHDDDDGCAITLFASGVTTALVAVMALIVALRLLNFVAPAEARVSRQVPRYWLPPLCGPPLS